MTRARRWARRGTVAALVGCALLVAMGALDSGGSASVDHAGPAGGGPTLGSVVIPNPPPGYTVTAQGLLNASRFASDAPDPPVTTAALSTLGDSVGSDARAWHADAGVDRVQDAAMARAPGATTTTAPSDRGKKGASVGTIGLAVVVVAILAAAVAAPGLLRRRRLAQEAAAASPPSHHPPPPASAGDAVDDLREQRG